MGPTWLVYKLLAGRNSYCYLTICVSFSGLVADKTKSYYATFFSAGGIETVGLIILLGFICLKRGDLTEKKIQSKSRKSSFTELLVIDRETVL